MHADDAYMNDLYVYLVFISLLETNLSCKPLQIGNGKRDREKERESGGGGITTEAEIGEIIRQR